MFHHYHQHIVICFHLPLTMTAYFYEFQTLIFPPSKSRLCLGCGNCPWRTDDASLRTTAAPLVVRITASGTEPLAAASARAAGAAKAAALSRALPRPSWPARCHDSWVSWGRSAPGVGQSWRNALHLTERLERACAVWFNFFQLFYILLNYQHCYLFENFLSL
jgi:hypothetical protein